MTKLFFIFLIVIKSFSASDYQIKLINTLTTMPYSDVQVQIVRENTIRCVTAPCPSNEVTFATKTSSEGLLDLSNILANNRNSGALYLRSEKFHGMNIPELSQLNNGKTLYLRPTEIDSSYKELILINKITNQPLEELEVVFSKEDKDCASGNCPEFIYKAKTNKLGRIFYPPAILFPDGLAQTTPVWIHIKNFKPQERHHHHSDPAKLIPKD